MKILILNDVPDEINISDSTKKISEVNEFTDSAENWCSSDGNLMLENH